jgi:acyl-CoA reductase-like NAD-dependent aldehyde dehydrogenase
MSHPATVVKNSDGTYTVRVQHTIGGSLTEVDFKNPVFGQALAEGYAAFLNGAAVVDAKVAQLVTDAKPALADAQADLQRLVDAAEKEAENIIAAAKLEAGKLKTEAEAAFAEAKTEAEKLLTEAKVEAAKLLHDVATKIDPPVPPAAPAAKPVVEDEN